MKLLQPCLSNVKRYLFLGLRFVVAIALVASLTLLGPGVSSAQATGIYDLDPVHAGDSTWVIDQADVLSRFKRGRLESRLGQIHEQTGAEVRFVVFRRLDYGETIGSFVSELFQAWFPEAESAQNQVLVALDTLTNTTAIRVGDGVKDRLSDEIATSLVEETMMAPIRQGDQYNQSLTDAADRLVAVLAGEPDPGPPVVEDKLNVERTFASKEETKESNATVIVIVLLVIATVVPMLTYFAYVR